MSAVPLKNLLLRFRRNRRGSAAVEFPLVAPVFFALLFAIIEVALMFFASQVLETITQQSARMILTGQAQNASFTQPQFKTYVCAQIPALFNCNSINVNVQDYALFSGINLSPFNPDGTFISNYCPGTSAKPIVVVQLSYDWPLFVTKLGFNMANHNGNRLLVATAAFQNEPFTVPAGGC